jgi:uncharacterized protein
MNAIKVVARMMRLLRIARPIFAAGLALLFGIVVAPPRSSATVISQVYGGGGNGGATYKNDFIEIFNNGTTAQSLNGLSVQYDSAMGAFAGSNVTDLPNIMLVPGQYFLIQEAGGPGGTVNLPSPDATGTINLSETDGVVALVNGTTSLNCGNPTPCSPSQLAAVIDLVGYGGANLFEGTGPAQSPSSTTAIIRAGGGYTDTNDNFADFGVGSPDPRNTESALNVTIGATPLPAALPLFATGLGAMGLFGWRKKRKPAPLAA